MFQFVRNRLKFFYFRRFKGMDNMAIRIMELRKRGITIGNDCRIFTDISSTEPTLVQIGDRVTISSDVTFCTHDNAIIKAVPGKTDIVGRICIGDDCFIGMKSIVMYGVTLGDHCIVGAGAVVTHSFPAHTVLAGNPAKAICTIDEYAKKNEAKAIDFNQIPTSSRKAFFESHPELLVER